MHKKTTTFCVVVFVFVHWIRARRSQQLGHIVLETDSLYLALVPYRGKRNKSSYVTLVAQKLAEIYNLSIEEIAQITTENSKAVFWA